MTKSLIQRLEEASEGSRELDREVWSFLSDRRQPKPGLFTASIDAALALAERVLPGSIVDLHIYPDRSFAAVEYEKRLYVSRVSAKASIALVIAILKAKESHNV